jgi:CCR4-NOT complex subunit CAF16
LVGIVWLTFFLGPLDATHIYDHIETFPTHICHLRLGRTPDELVTYTPTSTITEDAVAAEEKRGELLGIALNWLRMDREVRKQRDKERGKERGAKRNEEVSMRCLCLLERSH